jgi:hypothetical protein
MSGAADLAGLTALMLEQELRRLRQERQARAALEAGLAQMQAMREAAWQDSGAVTARQRLGADTLWQGWLVAKRAGLMRDMALARAREDEATARARTAFSRAEASAMLVAEARAGARQERLQREAEALDALARLRRGGPE